MTRPHGETRRIRMDRNDALLKRIEFKWFEIKNLLRFTCSPKATKGVLEEMERLAGWVSDETRDALEHENDSYSVHFLEHLGVTE